MTALSSFGVYLGNALDCLSRIDEPAVGRQEGIGIGQVSVGKTT
jgi:hypothetical protein